MPRPQDWESLGPRPRGSRGRRRASSGSAEGQDPPGELHLFLTLFLPLQPAWLSGQAGEPWAGMRRWRGFMIVSLELQWIHSVDTGLVSGDNITEASDALSEESQHVPILLRWKLRYREGNGARRPHSLSVTELADYPNWWPLKGSRGSPGVGMRWKKAGKSKNSIQKAQAISGSTGNKCWGSARCGSQKSVPKQHTVCPTPCPASALTSTPPFLPQPHHSVYPP